MAINSITFEGKITKQGVEMRFTSDGDPVTAFTVGVSGGKKKGTDEWKPTTWVRVTCWKWLAEKANEKFSEGDYVVVQGRFETSEWEDTAGVKKSNLECTAASVSKVVSE